MAVNHAATLTVTGAAAEIHG